MTKIENQAQYDWSIKRVEELLPLVKEDDPPYNLKRTELDYISNLVADYSEQTFSVARIKLTRMMKLRMSEMGLNQKALAKLIGVSAQQVGNYLSGKVEPPLRVAAEISLKLDIDANIVLGISHLVEQKNKM